MNVVICQSAVTGYYLGTLQHELISHCHTTLALSTAVGLDFVSPRQLFSHTCLYLSDIRFGREQTKVVLDSGLGGVELSRAATNNDFHD